VKCELNINIDSSQNKISMATENHRVLSCLTSLKHLENNSLRIIRIEPLAGLGITFLRQDLVAVVGLATSHLADLPVQQTQASVD